MHRDKTTFMVGIIFAIAGIGILISAIFVKRSTDQFMQTALSTSGIVDKIETYTERDADGDLRTCYDVYVSYSTSDGTHYSGVKYGFYTTGMHEGSTVTVYYDPADPTHIMASEGAGMLVLIMVGMGLLFAVMGIFFVVRNRKPLDGEAV